jgi:hypothetical protein
MGYCKDCVYWKSYKIKYTIVETTECDQVKMVIDQENNVPDDGFALWSDAEDPTGLVAVLKTGPMFGCVNFKEK